MTGPPVGDVLREAAAGRFPVADGRADVVPTWRPGVEGVIAFSGHALVCVDEGRQVRAEALLSQTVASYPPGLGGASDPRTVVALAGAGAWIDSLDVLLACTGTSAVPDLVLEEVSTTSHPRAGLARSLRDDVRTLVADDVLVTVSTGIGGLSEISVEVAESGRGAGLGRRAARAAVALVPEGEPVLAAVSPGNVTSLRAFLGAGFVPLAGVQLWRPGGRAG